MKKVILIVVVCAAIAVPCSAQNWRAFVGGGRPGLLDAAIVSGIAVDLTGYTLVLVGGYDFTDTYTSLALFSVGSLCMSGGGLIWNLCLDARQSQIEAMGGDVLASSRSAAWTYTWLSVGCTVGAVGAGFLIPDEVAAFITSIVFSAGAVIFESINWTGPRARWSGELYAATPTSTSFRKAGNPACRQRELGAGGKDSEPRAGS